MKRRITTTVFTYFVLTSFAVTCITQIAYAKSTSKSKQNGQKSPYIQMMDEMMVKMHKAEQQEIRCTDTNFLASMIPHHEGAIIMAEYEIKHGKDAQMIALAKQIITEQKKEIALMNQLLKEFTSCPKSDAVTEAYQKAMSGTMTPMMADFPTEAINKEQNPDRAFAMAMIPHHQAAVDMARVILQYSSNAKVRTLAQDIITTQNAEITAMQTFLTRNKASSTTKNK